MKKPLMAITFLTITVTGGVVWSYICIISIISLRFLFNNAQTLSFSRLLLFCNSKVFFTDYGSTPRVERCDMDGQNRTKLVDTKIVFPHGITLDLVNRLVYWADAYLDYIEVVDYEGKNRHTIIQGLLVRAGCCAKSYTEVP